jgi:hypothetical protein
MTSITDDGLNCFQNCFQKLFQNYAPHLQDKYNDSIKKLEIIDLNNSEYYDNENEQIDKLKPLPPLLPLPPLPQPSSMKKSNTPISNIKLKDEDVAEFCEWIDSMSKIGSMCIKYTFLRDLYKRNRSNVVTLMSRELIAPEKKWIELITKHVDKFKQPDSCAHNENAYINRCIDVDCWRSCYWHFMKELKSKFFLFNLF